MARRFRNFRSNMVKSGRTTFWFQATAVQATITAASTATLITSLNAAALALRPFTVIRSRGYMQMTSDQSAASEVQEAAFGKIIVSDQAVAIGVTAVPTPSTDSQSSWLLYERMADQLTLLSAVGFTHPTGRFMQIDSKAMRKVEEGQDLIGVLETGPNSSGVTVSTFIRTLIKLH